MYWQVYLHKTVVGAERLLISILKRAGIGALRQHLFATPALDLFLRNSFTLDDFRERPDLLDTFAELDVSDITTAVKIWSKGPDYILRELCFDWSAGDCSDRIEKGSILESEIGKSVNGSGTSFQSMSGICTIF